MKSKKHMKNKNRTVWSTRFKSSTSKIFEQIGASIDTDKRLFEEDILGSIDFKDKKFLKWLSNYD